ncbi:MAG TPA: phosphoribosylformylglycinamidine cyclo-ligase [Nitrososphaerales archaeon]|nr:phosphoribosylformylglycinamidine cyclo-ligase [Nitrososphaerales archaeon]
MTRYSASQKGILKNLTYASVGVNRTQRSETRLKISKALRHQKSVFGSPIELPFGLIFPSTNPEEFFDLEIEGIGTKTLLAEYLPGAYNSIGIDGVAMAVNDVIRSGSKPILLTDAIHIARSDPRIVKSIINGVLEGAVRSGCPLASGETGDVPEVFHLDLHHAKSQPFDLIVSCLGLVQTERIVQGKIKEGDAVIGIESSGIHSNGVSLARRILLKQWGGKFGPYEAPDGFSRTVAMELLEPTRIYVKEILEAGKRFKLKAAIHITGDGFAKFQRILDFQGRAKHFGFEFDFQSPLPRIFDLIERTAASLRLAVSKREMFQTFNMGFGFAVIVEPEIAEDVVDLFNKYHPAKAIGRVTTSGRIKIYGPKTWDRPVILER